MYDEKLKEISHVEEVIEGKLGDCGKKRYLWRGGADESVLGYSSY
jgi:hypothetical protein